MVLRALAALLCVSAAVWLALWYFIPAPPLTITIAAGSKGGAFEQIADRYRERLTRHHIKLDVRLTGGAADNLKLMEDRSSGIDAAFLFGGQSNAEQSPDLLSLGRITFNPIWVFYRGTETLDRLSQLKGKRIGAFLGLAPLQRVLSANGINADNATLLPRMGLPAVKALKDGEVDVIVILAELNSPQTQSLLHDPTVRLMNLTQAEALTKIVPSLNRLVLPQGVVDLDKNIPASDVNLIATTTAVVVRTTLHPELIYLLAQTLQEEHRGAGVFQREGEFPTMTDPEFVVADEAREFYKNGPSLLQQYLPFLMINYAKRLAAIIVAAVAIVIPVFTYAPRLYYWLIGARLMKLYRRLRDIETELESQLTTAQVEAVQEKLESIYRAARILPMRHSDLFINLMTHIRLMRMELASRLAVARD